MMQSIIHIHVIDYIDFYIKLVIKLVFQFQTN